MTEADAQTAQAALLAQYGKTAPELEAALTAAGMERTAFDAQFHRLLTVDRFAAEQARAAGITPSDYVGRLQGQAQISYSPRAEEILAWPAEWTNRLADAGGAATSLSGNGAETADAGVLAEPIAAEPRPASQGAGHDEAQAAASASRGIGPGQIAPDFSLALLGGEEAVLTWADLLGAPSVLSFWTTWCPYCRKQMPGLIAAQQQHADQDIQIIGINVREDDQTVAEYVSGNGVNFPVALDPNGAAAQLFAVSGFPTTYFLDAEGRIVRRHVGALTPEDIEDALDRLLAEVQ